MKKLIVAILLITLAFTVGAVYGNVNSIVICYSMEQFRGDELQRQLNEEFPNKNIVVTYMPTGKAASKVYAEGETVDIDILVGLETGYLQKIQDYLVPLENVSNIDYLDEFKSELNGNKWVIWEKQAGAIVVNTNTIEKYGLEIPTTYADLLKPEYKKLVAMPDPKSSGTGYFFYKSWVNAYGEENALKYVDELHKNLKQFTESGSGPIKMLKQGEIAVGLGLTFQAVNESNAGQPFEIIMPELGSPYSVTGTAMIKGREKNKDIMDIYKYIVNDFMIYDKEYFCPEKLYHGQINRIPNYPQDIKYADMSGIQDGNEKERLLGLWKY